MFKCNQCNVTIKDDDIEICPFCGQQAQTREQCEQRAQEETPNIVKDQLLNPAITRKPQETSVI